MQITGTIDTLLDAVTKGNYTSRKLWLLIPDGQYPQTVEVECGGKQANLFDNLKAGQDVTLDVNLRGRKWTSPEGKTSVFNSLSAWKVTAAQSEVTHLHAPNMQNSTAAITENNNGQDLPF